MTLQITEIYASIQGEAAFAGFPCVFIRLTGCPLRCRWCDTAYSFSGGKAMELEEVIETVKNFGVNLVELTGGEPLAQTATIPLMQRLLDSGFRVMLETSGAEDIQAVPLAVHIIMDIKCPDSKMVEKNNWENISYLKKSDEIKFVLASRGDYDWAKLIMAEYQLHTKANILMSCAFGLLQPKDLSAWIIEDKLPARLNLQQHKYIWNPRAKGV